MENLVSHHGSKREGLRVLLVDQDHHYLQQLEKMLQSCRYHVTICVKAKDALSFLREEKARFDIVIADIHNMVDMDGFDFLATLTAELKSLPIVIMMSSIVSEEEEETIGLKGMEEGACAYFTKPITLECVKLIWQYVVRERIRRHEVPTNDEKRDNKRLIQLPSNYDRNEEEEGEEIKGIVMKKKKNRDICDHEMTDDDHQRKKKPRVRWKKELNEKFETAIKLIRQTQEEVVPKKILECMEKMGVTGLTRQNISSHLQKVRAKFLDISEFGASFDPNHFLPYLSATVPPIRSCINNYHSTTANLGQHPNTYTVTSSTQLPVFITPNDSSSWEMDDIFLLGN